MPCLVFFFPPVSLLLLGWPGCVAHGLYMQLLLSVLHLSCKNNFTGLLIGYKQQASFRVTKACVKPNFLGLTALIATLVSARALPRCADRTWAPVTARDALFWFLCLDMCTSVFVGCVCVRAGRKELHDQLT